MSGAVILQEKTNLEQLIKDMKAKGYEVKDFSDKPAPERSYRSWYYRIRKTHNISGVWLINHPNVWFYRKRERSVVSGA